MAVNQAQVDHILSSASADDPEVKLQKIQDEMDLIKVSIKRLLIDIRERMNELENPFASAVYGLPSAGAGRDPGGIGKDIASHGRQAPDRENEALGEQHPGALVHSGNHQNPVSYPCTDPGMGTPQRDPIAHQVPAPRADLIPEDRLIEAIRSQMVTRSSAKGEILKQEQEKLRLTKVHRLFEWTSRMVKKYGHDRLDMMLQSYRAMGYITKESNEQVKEIAKLMPGSIGESHEIGPDEFIRELYTLNRILNPADMTLDRDMIEVLMEQHRRTGTSPKDAHGVEKESKEDWVRMLDGV